MHAALPRACAQDPWEGSRIAMEAMVRDRSPDRVGEFAACLEALDFDHAAQFHHMVVLEEGRDHPAFAASLGAAFELGVDLRDPWTLLGALEGLDESAFPAAGDALLTVYALSLMRSGDLDHAESVLADVNARFAWFALAQLHLGRAHEEAGRAEAAEGAYRAAVRAAASSRAAVPVQALALVQTARMYRRQGRLEDAVVLYDHVDRDTPIAGRVSTEAAAIWLDLDEPELAAIRIRRARAATRAGELVPDLDLVDARLQAARCRPAAARRTLRRSRVTRDALLLVARGLASTGRPSAALAWSQHLGPDRIDMGLPPSLIDRLGTDQEYASARDHLARIEGDLERIRRSPHQAWNASVGAYITAILLDSRDDLRRRMGTALLMVGRDLEQSLHAIGQEEAALAEALASWEGCRRARGSHP